ncbi:MAG: EF-hand domain-containing protein [Candidatus Poseidoniia archaeon]|nr:EF-hand domain-containing protein [Candidatus Poseidoniia archaeon]
MTDKLEDKNSQQLRIQKQYRKWKKGDDKKEHISTYYPGMDRLTNFKQNYSKRSGDILMSKNFQRVYHIIVPIIFLGILGIVLYFLIGLPVNGLYHFIWCDTDCTDLPVSPGIIVVAFLDSLLLLLMLINMFREPWKSQILVKTKNGGYDFRFRKGTKMESYKNKMLTNLFLKADTNKDGTIDFTEFLRIGGEDHLTDEEIKEYEEDFEKADKDGDGKLSLEEMKDFSDI